MMVPAVEANQLEDLTEEQTFVWPKPLPPGSCNNFQKHLLLRIRKHKMITDVDIQAET